MPKLWGRACAMAAFAGFAGAIGAAPVHAAATLDANYEATDGNLIVGARLTDAQTFTVLSSGTMTSASVLIARGSTPTDGITLQIRTVTGGLPSEFSVGPSVLATATRHSGSVGTAFDWVDFDFADFAVTAGQHLALVLSSSTVGSEYSWFADLAWPYLDARAGTYAGGRGFDEGASSGGHLTWGDVTVCAGAGRCNDPAGVDFAFRTYVDAADGAVPEPATWATMLLGFGGLGYAMRRTPQIGTRIRFG